MHKEIAAALLVSAFLVVGFTAIGIAPFSVTSGPTGGCTPGTEVTTATQQTGGAVSVNGFACTGGANSAIPVYGWVTGTSGSTVASNKTLTDSFGNFEVVFSGLAPGAYTITVSLCPESQQSMCQSEGYSNGIVLMTLATVVGSNQSTVTLIQSQSQSGPECIQNCAPNSTFKIGYMVAGALVILSIIALVMGSKLEGDGREG
jgi:hypothetical protein